jgi:hypothetical protein
MAFDAAGIGETVSSVKGILGMFFPDKTESEKNQLAAAFAIIKSQTDIDQAEAQSSDPLQHWRGGLGWVCVAGYAYNFVLQPLLHPWVPQLLPLDIGPLATLTLGMLGLGGLHVAERVKGAA